MFSYFLEDGGEWGDIFFFEDARDISGIADVLHSWTLKFTVDSCDDRIVISKSVSYECDSHLSYIFFATI